MCGGDGGGEGEEVEGYVGVVVVLGIERKGMCKEVVVSGKENVEGGFVKERDKVWEEFEKRGIEVGLGVVGEEDGVGIDLGIEYEVEDGREVGEWLGEEVGLDVGFLCVYIERWVDVEEVEVELVVEEVDWGFEGIVLGVREYGE